MNLDYVPLMRIQREIQGMPLGMARFQHYLRTIFNHDGPDGELFPLVAANPMGKTHVTELLDTLLAMNADAIGESTAKEAASRLSDVAGDCKIAMVVADDLKGGWTNRYDCEYTLRFGPSAHKRQPRPSWSQETGFPRWARYFWITCILWSSETPSVKCLRETVLSAAHRVAFVRRHGPARTLRAMLDQEGHVMAMAGCTTPELDEDDLEYTREVLKPFLDASDMRTAIECLFGDEAGRTLGFTPRGLSPWAGIALALHDARAVRADNMSPPNATTSLGP